MARITVEDCLEKVENRFALCHLATARARAMMEDDEEEGDNKCCVSALREVAAGKIFFNKTVIEQLDKENK